MPMEPLEGRKVKSRPADIVEATDRHERAKDYPSPSEMARLLDAAKIGRHGTRDHLLLLMTYCHGLRVSEAVGLRRDELDLDRPCAPLPRGSRRPPRALRLWSEDLHHNRKRIRTQDWSKMTRNLVFSAIGNDEPQQKPIGTET
jgi:integrase